MKLKSAIEYWELIYYDEDLPIGVYGALYDNYINFLKQPLQLWMFIPCDKEGKPLEKPAVFEAWKNPKLKVDIISDFKCKEYQQACDRVLFKGFELVEHSKGYFYIENDVHVVAQKNYGCEWVFVGYKTVEDLSGKVDLVEKVAEQFKY